MTATDLETDPDCLFCKIRDGRIPAKISYRDEHVLAFADIGPKAPLHHLVIPLRHKATLADAVPEDAALYGRLMVVAAKLARESGQASGGFRVVMNAGPDAGQSVHHVHLHVLAGRQLAWPPG
jgi:histidine triad (HIT) family protein